MNIDEILNERNLSKYRLAHNTGIPYSTINYIGIIRDERSN